MEAKHRLWTVKKKVKNLKSKYALKNLKERQDLRKLTCRLFK